MRSNYNILWLDDDFDNDTAVLRNLVEHIEAYLKNKGYISNIIKVSNKQSALDAINKSEKIDLFLSDYNIDNDNEFSGFDFLVATREKYKQEMLLYSNQEEGQIKTHLLNYLKKDSTPLQYFSKFIFESATNTSLLENAIKSLIDVTLMRWEELNALRGLYLSQTSQIHYEAKAYIMNHVPDTELYNNFYANYSNAKDELRKDKILEILDGASTDIGLLNTLEFYEVQCILSDENNELFDIWEEIRSIRNGCAHISQFHGNNGENYIRLMGKNRLKIKESEIDKYRRKLLNFMDLYYQYYPSLDAKEKIQIENFTYN